MTETKTKAKAQFQASYILFIIVCLLIMVLVLVPIGYMAFESITADDGTLTVQNYVKYFGRADIRAALFNSIVVAVGIGLFASLIGVTLAFGVSRTNMRFKTLVKSTITITIMTPPFLLTMAYIILAGPNQGLVNRLIRAVFHLSTNYGPINIYSVWAIVILGLPQGIATIFMMVFPALENMDPYLEEAARMAGANARKTALNITIPLVRPAILSGLILSFGQSLALYGVPRMLNINVLTTKIRESITVMDLKMGAVLSTSVTILSLLAVFLYRRNVRSSKHYSTISAKGFRPSVMKLGKAKNLFSALGLLYALFGFLIPYTTLIIASFLKNVGNGFQASNFTVSNYISLLHSTVAKTALKNSLFLGFITATAVVMLGLVASFIIVRMKVRGKGMLEYLCNMPSGISGTALAMGLIFMYLTYPLNQMRLYGTIWMLFIAYTTRMLPSGVRYCQSAFIQINTELEEASRISGASWGRTIRKITVPLAKTGIAYAWILTFVMAFPELSSSVMLRNAGTDVVATAILDLWDGAGGLTQAAAFGSVVFLFVTALVVVAQKLTGRSMVGDS